MVYTRRMDTDEIRRALEKHGRARAKAREAAAAQSEAIAEAARHGVAEGMTKVEICRLAQISRPALDAMLEE